MIEKYLIHQLSNRPNSRGTFYIHQSGMNCNSNQYFINFLINQQTFTKSVQNTFFPKFNKRTTCATDSIYVQSQLTMIASDHATTT